LRSLEDKRGPGLKFPPPLLPLTLIGSGYLADIYLPLPISEESGLWLTGLVVVIAAVCLALIAVLQLLRAKTHLEPWQPTTFIIQSGIFRYSRNPIYLTFLHRNCRLPIAAKQLVGARRTATTDLPAATAGHSTRRNLSGTEVRRNLPCLQTPRTPLVVSNPTLEKQVST
jgi:hypothetical protein